MVLASAGACGGTKDDTGAPTGACPTFGQPESLAVVDSPDIDEASGLAASARFDGVFWTHNDDGDGVLYAIGGDGQVRARLRIPGVDPVDWEAVGSNGDGQLFIADIGDNEQERADITIWQVSEPEALDGDVSAGVASPIVVSWPDGPTDAEAILVDPTDGMLYVLSRDPQAAQVLRIDPSGAGTAEVVLTLDLDTAPLAGTGAVRDATFTDEGAVLLRMSDAIFWFPPAGNVLDTLQGTPCAAQTPQETDGEAITATPTGYATLAEGNQPVLWHVQMETP